MSEPKTVTKARRLLLEYIRDNQPVALFPMGTAMVHKCEVEGLIELAGEPKPGHFAQWRLTARGEEIVGLRR